MHGSKRSVGQFNFACVLQPACNFPLIRGNLESCEDTSQYALVGWWEDNVS